MKDVYYFSHDSNARNDEKILMLRSEHGWEGYGIYWAIVEMMFEASDTSLSHQKIKGIATGLNVAFEKLNEIISTCIDERLFQSDGEMFWSNSLKARKDKFKEISAKRSEAGKKGAQMKQEKEKLSKPQANDKQMISKCSTNLSKGKERKGKEIKENIKREGDFSNDIKSLLDFFNTLNFANVHKLTEKRKKHLKSRIKAMGVEELKAVWKKANNTPFLQGKNKRKWKANFDWLINESNLVKVKEDYYGSAKQSDGEFDVARRYGVMLELGIEHKLDDDDQERERKEKMIDEYLKDNA